MSRLLVIFLGGGIGSALRWLLAGLVQDAAARWPATARLGVFPFGTLAVNAVGCLLIGVLGAYFAGPQRIAAEWRLFLLIGLLGGFTTFSSFAWETLSLASDREIAPALANVALSNALGLGLAWAGYRLGLRAFGV